jgi:hypothetical protein
VGHPSIENKTRFAFEPLFLADEEGRPLLVPVVKATFEFEGRIGLELAEQQVPLKIEGEYWGQPDFSSYKYEPECAFVKLTTDVVLIGHAHAPEPDTSELRVTLRVGELEKTVRVVGDRVWYRSLGRIAMTRALPFEVMPLVYERSFGGWDRNDPDPKHHAFEPRNPVGVGFCANPRNFKAELRLPNVEDPEEPLRELGQKPPPAGFGFTSPNWQPRASYAGTYDVEWLKDRAPLLPKDFDRRFLNSASPGLIAPAYLTGNEEVTVVNASPEGRLWFHLPGIPPPRVRVQRSDAEDAELETKLDTVIVNTDDRQLLLLWRAQLPLRDGPHDVRAIEVSSGGGKHG